MRVQAAPVEGRANAGLCADLAARLGLPGSAVNVARGPPRAENCSASRASTSPRSTNASPDRKTREDGLHLRPPGLFSPTYPHETLRSALPCLAAALLAALPALAQPITGAPCAAVLPAAGQPTRGSA